jgi:D-3-phosphoglycerate dehydrogenase
MYLAGERGVPLAARPVVEKAFERGSLEVHWAASIEEIRADTDILVTMGATVGREVVAKCPRLSLVAVAFTGTDHVDLNACRSQGVTVINTPGYSTDSTAQLALTLVLEHLHRLPECHATIQAGGWACPLQEDLQSKMVGIVGTGSLGVRCAELFKAFKVKGMIGYDLVHSPSFLATGGSYLPSLAALFLDADIVVVCLPLTEKTRGIISARILQLLRPESVLVNVGRGDVIDEAAMATLLKQNRFRAALDVYSKEPLPQTTHFALCSQMAFS